MEGAAEALIRLARLRIDHDEQRWVFFMLGDIYDRHMPDARRAETAFHRALKLAPDDHETMSRLASLYQREGDVTKAAELLKDLVQQEMDPERNRDHRIRLAEIIEQGGQVREAEGILVQLRKTRPTDIAVLRAMMHFYTRQDAHPALSMLLSRAINDLRNLVESNPGDAQAWTHLVEILIARNRQDAARCCASAAAAVHALDVRLAQALDAQGGIPGAQSAIAESEVDDLLAPPLFSPAARMIFRLAEEAFQKVLPYDLKAVRAEKLSPMDPFVRAGTLVAPWFGISSFQVMVTNLASSICIPISNDPITILVSRDLLAQTTDLEKAFLIARAMKLAQGSLSVVLRSKPDEVALAVSGLIRVYDSLYSPLSLDAQALASMSKKIGKNISRKARDPLAPLAIEVGGSPDFRIENLRDAIVDFGNRVALLATGALPTAVSAILKSSGGGAPSATESQAIQANREAWSLVRFAISDQYFEARNRTRADRS